MNTVAASDVNGANRSVSVAHPLPDELVALTAAAKEFGGSYISHMRSEDVRFDEALGELLEIGRATGMPVQVTHMKLALVDRHRGRRR